ncbi:Putative DNA-binding domain-containing protein [Actinokineospora alba]|uniref:Putative DNA-binding domain-containing protein n=1 Tax=Actinokineospora alba TaxID=504798 RepID=A0A1H0LEH1_9PSEU|nr:ATP-binding protein [Actinokineospora alba]TDP67299.1 putative DNA-binding protein [Actinokineospora alba]SDJ01178.1 Putative DNA-binding domain-containing protein [Actinokineospora alba]SDO66604.1 Putative DNA-binding domain-containing protein [Actinokineospora alba]
MSVFRSARLEALLGATVDQATYHQVIGLVTNRVSEDVDLEFKGDYKNTDSGRAEFAADVAQFANATSGLLIIGMDEDKAMAQAAGPSGISVVDTEITRYINVIADRISPPLPFTIRPVENPDQPGTGFILIAVSRGPVGPHAVRVNDSLRYPRRVGRRKVLLHENEVALAYRDRFTGLQSRLDAAEAHERYLVDQLSTDRMYVVVTLVPDLDGYRDINTDEFSAFRQAVLDTSPWLLEADNPDWYTASVGPDRLVASGLPRPDAAHLITEPGCVLHRSGAGSFVAYVGERPDSQAAHVIEFFVVAGVLAGLRFLAEQAVQHASASGSASLRATLVPADETKATFLTQRLRWSPHAGERPVHRPPVATALADLHRLAVDGRELTRATYALASRLVQHFGIPETRYLTVDGAVRIGAWADGSTKERARRWADTNEVKIDESHPSAL